MHGFSQEYMAESVTSISQYLTDGGAGPSLYLTHEERQLEPTSNRALIPSSFCGINNCTMAHLERKDHYTANANEVDNLQSDTVDDMLRDMVAPVFAVMEFDKKDENLSELMFNTMRTTFRPSKKSFPDPCKVCNGRHDADACRVRGTSFLPEWLLKNVK